MNKKLTLFGALLLTGWMISTAAREARPVVKEITTLKEYETISKAIRRPTVFVFNSSTCQACNLLNKAVETVAKTYSNQANFYRINDLKSDAFKGLPQKLKIKGYPTTYLTKPGAEPCSERGSMEVDELDKLVYRLIHGKPKPMITRPAQPAKK